MARSCFRPWPTGMLLILTCAASGWANNITCSLSPATTWTAAGNGNWTTGSNWSNGSPNGSNAACIIDGASTVSLTTFADITGLQLAEGNTLNVTSLTPNSSLLIAVGSPGTPIINAGTINLTATSLQVSSPVTLSGSGTLNLANADIYSSSSGTTLINQSTIAGTGTIGPGIYTVNLVNQGTVNANVTAGTLGFGTNAYGNTVTNTGGLLEATNGGTLAILGSNVVNNFGGNVTANGGTVLVGGTIQGGTLTATNGGTLTTFSSGFAVPLLDGASQGALTLSDGTTFTAATGSLTQLQGTINLGTGTGAILQTSGGLQTTGNTTLSGPGSLTLAAAGWGSTSNTFVVTNQSLIQGSGEIGEASNCPTGNSCAGSAFTLVNQATINANSSGNTLTNGSTIINNGGLLEATNGGTLKFDLPNDGGVVNNAGGGVISANGGTIINGTIIQGGTLSTLNGGVMKTGSGGGTLDGATHGAITLSDFSTYTAGSGTFTDLRGMLNLGTAAGAMLQLGGTLQIDGAVTLSGPGSVTMTAGSLVYASGNPTLTNQSIIQGAGQIGFGIYGFTLSNQGTVNANSNGGSLELLNDTVNNKAGGILESGNGGTLWLAGDAVTNAGLIHVAQGATLLITGGDFGGTTLHNTGIIQVDGTLEASSLILDGGLLEGTGTVNLAGTGTLTNTSGTVKGGDSPGTLTVSGNYTQAAAGSLEVDFNGTALGDWSVLDVTGDVSLAGTLDVVFIDSFTGSAMYSGEVFDILNFGADPGGSNFSIFNLPDLHDGLYLVEQLDQVNHQVDLVVEGSLTPSEVPEPSSFTLLLAGLAPLGWLVRRRGASRGGSGCPGAIP